MPFYLATARSFPDDSPVTLSVSFSFNVYLLRNSRIFLASAIDSLQISRKTLKNRTSLLILHFPNEISQEIRFVNEENCRETHELLCEIKDKQEKVLETSLLDLSLEKTPVFKHNSRSGRKVAKFLRISQDIKEIQWSNAADSIKYSSIKLKEIVHFSTSPWKTGFPKGSLSKIRDFACCFSLKTCEKTLNIELFDENSAKLWILGLKRLLKSQQILRNSLNKPFVFHKLRENIAQKAYETCVFVKKATKFTNSSEIPRFSLQIPNNYAKGLRKSETERRLLEKNKENRDISNFSQGNARKVHTFAEKFCENRSFANFSSKNKAKSLRNGVSQNFSCEIAVSNEEFDDLNKRYKKLLDEYLTQSKDNEKLMQKVLDLNKILREKNEEIHELKSRNSTKSMEKDQQIQALRRELVYLQAELSETRAIPLKKAQGFHTKPLEIAQNLNNFKDLLAKSQHFSIENAKLREELKKKQRVSQETTKFLQNSLKKQINCLKLEILEIKAAQEQDLRRFREIWPHLSQIYEFQQQKYLKTETKCLTLEKENRVLRQQLKNVLK